MYGSLFFNLNVKGGDIVCQMALSLSRWTVLPPMGVARCLPLQRLNRARQDNSPGHCRMEGALPGDILRLFPNIKVHAFSFKHFILEV